MTDFGFVEEETMTGTPTYVRPLSVSASIGYEMICHYLHYLVSWAVL